MYRPACRISHTGGRSAAAKHGVRGQHSNTWRSLQAHPRPAPHAAGAGRQLRHAPRAPRQRYAARASEVAAQQAAQAAQAARTPSRGGATGRPQPWTVCDKPGQGEDVPARKAAWSARLLCIFVVRRTAEVAQQWWWQRCHGLRARAQKARTDSLRLSRSRAWRTACCALLSVVGRQHPGCWPPLSQGAALAARVRGTAKKTARRTTP